VAPVCRVARVGEIEIETGLVRRFTFTVAEADFALSAVLVALTVKVPIVPGAVYSPLEETVPPVVDQATDVLELPFTDAVNCWVAFAAMLRLVGVTDTDTEAVGDASTRNPTELDWTPLFVLITVTLLVAA